MTLDEAIRHCYENSCDDSLCAMEHKQLAEWLEELKKLREEYVIKAYFSSTFDSIYKAMIACDNNQNWNVVNIYPTGWRQEVCVVYYTTK